MRSVLLAAIAVAFAGSATAQQTPRAQFDNGVGVVWTSEPAPADVWRAIADAGVSRSDESQWAAIACTVGENRRLSDCSVVDRSNPETRIGDGLLELVRYYRARSTDAAGQPVAGRRVIIAMGYGGTRIP